MALKRNAIGYDLNPIACFITENLISKDIDTVKLKNIADKIVEKIEDNFKYYEVKCNCGKLGELICGIWKNNEYIAKYYFCPICGNKMASTNDFDQRQVKKIDFPDNLWYPKDKLPDNADASYVYELFTKRNLLALSLLFLEIKKVEDKKIKNLLLYTFTSNLAFTSNIIPVNEKRFKQKRNCSGIWGFKRFWIPDFHVENNVFKYFKNRLKRTIDAKNETNQILKKVNGFGKVINASSENMEALKDKSIDFIFTDPPFGGMVPYFNLSTLWNLWLQFKVDYDNEIIIDNKHDESNYYRKMLSVFKECYRVLKDRKYLVLAFNNKNLKTWCILLDAIHNSGFSLEKIIPTEDGGVSFTQTTKSAKGSLKGHFVYVFKKEE
ncbi:MAG: DNA methyltransferase, partial [Methanosarcinales archaeon]